MLVKQTETFRKWNQRLRDETAKALIAARVYRLTKGHLGDVSPVGGGVSELRLHFGPGYRIYFYKRGSEIILLLCGGDKGSQQRDIEMARKMAADWRENDA